MCSGSHSPESTLLPPEHNCPLGLPQLGPPPQFTKAWGQAGFGESVTQRLCLQSACGGRAQEPDSHTPRAHPEDRTEASEVEAAAQQLWVQMKAGAGPRAGQGLRAGAAAAVALRTAFAARSTSLGAPHTQLLPGSPPSHSLH